MYSFWPLISAENDDISADNLNSRLVVVKADGLLRGVVTSFEEAGTGAYTLTIREFKSERPRKGLKES